MTLPNYTDVAIVGAGVQALTLTTHLLKKTKKHYNKFLVFDPSQTWLSQWQRQFAAQQISHLRAALAQLYPKGQRISARSPSVHHPDPNPSQLRNFAEARYNELFLPYDRPGTKLFNDFCHEVIRLRKMRDLKLLKYRNGGKLAYFSLKDRRVTDILSYSLRSLI